MGQRRRLSVLIALLAFAGGAGAQTRGTFVKLGDMRVVRGGHTATLLIDGTVLIAAGDGAEIYYPMTRKFIRTGSMVKSRDGHTATLLPNGKVLVTGGDADLTAELYDPETHQFSLTGSMISRQRWSTATLLDNGKVLVAGDPDAELYDPVTGTFTLAGPYAAESRSLTATLLADGRVLFAGDNPVQIYDPATNTFSVAGPVQPAGVDGSAITALNNGKVLITGGMNDEFAPAGRTASAELYDPATGTFTYTASMHFPRDFHAAVRLQDGEVLIVGGDTGVFLSDGESVFGGSLASAELYDPSSGTFSSAGTMNYARTGPQATLLSDGTVLITGGVCYCAGIGWPENVAGAEIYYAPRTKTRAARTH